MHLVDEFGGLLVLAGRSPAALEGHSVALTYGRAYRLTRALLDPGPGRLQVRGRFNRLVDGLSVADRDSLHDLLVNADPTVFMIVDPRPLIRTTAAIQNTYALSLLQAETLAAAVTGDLAVRFVDRDSATNTLRTAATELGVDLAVVQS